MSGGNAATAGTFGTIQVNADGSYVYTLTSPFTEPTANNGTDTVNAAESFTYRVTDANGNTATGTININIVDDVPAITANGDDADADGRRDDSGDECDGELRGCVHLGVWRRWRRHDHLCAGRSMPARRVWSTRRPGRT